MFYVCLSVSGEPMKSKLVRHLPVFNPSVIRLWHIICYKNICIYLLLALLPLGDGV